jgi:hypothetical protein
MTLELKFHLVSEHRGILLATQSSTEIRRGDSEKKDGLPNKLLKIYTSGFYDSDFFIIKLN